MAVTETRLFPPIMAPYLPAKNINSVNQGIRITFDINELNNITDIKEIHVVITRQSDYNSLFIILRDRPFSCREI